MLRGKVQHIGYRGIIEGTDAFINSIDNTLGTFVIEQKEHNQWMKDHSQRLEKSSKNWLRDSSNIIAS